MNMATSMAMTAAAVTVIRSSAAAPSICEGNLLFCFVMLCSLMIFHHGNISSYLKILYNLIIYRLLSLFQVKI